MMGFPGIGVFLTSLEKRQGNHVHGFQRGSGVGDVFDPYQKIDVVHFFVGGVTVDCRRESDSLQYNDLNSGLLKMTKKFGRPPEAKAVLPFNDGSPLSDRSL